MFVPSRLLYRMQRSLIETGRFLQEVDLDEVEDPLVDVFSRRMMFSISAMCESRMGQGQLLDVVNGQATVHILNDLGEDGSFLDMGVIVEGGQELFDKGVNETVDIVIESIYGDNPWQSVEVETRDGDMTATPASTESNYFDETMSVYDIGDTCRHGPDNTEDDRPLSSLSVSSRKRTVEVLSVENIVTLLPYSNFPSITQTVNLYLTPSVLVLEMSSLFLLFVDLWFAKEIEPPKPLTRGMTATVLLVWLATILVGSITIASFISVHSRKDHTFVGCGTWTMTKIRGGLIGRYVCRIISLDRTTAWYGYLLYVVPVGVMLVVSCVTCFALYVRIRYGFGKNPTLSRALVAWRIRGVKVPAHLDREDEESRLEDDEQLPVVANE